MLPFEILLSESQERMLIVVKQGSEEEVLRIFRKWDLNCAQIGVVTDTQRLKFYQDNQLVADVPAHDLVLGGGAPVYHREYREPGYYAKLKKFDPASIPQPDDYKAVAKFLLQHPNIASKQWVAEQYDSMIGTNTLTTNAPSDAAVVRIKGTQKAIAVKVDCNSRYVHADPKIGAAIAVAESARNVVCSGGLPVAITNCLNFGNPYDPEVYWQFVHTILGMKEACEKLGTPVTGGNVSFYNQSHDGGAVFPTPVIGMLGILDDFTQTMTLNFKQVGDTIFLLGEVTDDINCSEYLYSYHHQKASPAPYFDLDQEQVLQQQLAMLISERLVNAVHDVADGGLFVALAESAMAGRKGFRIRTLERIRKDAFLFGEGQSRAVVTVSDDQLQQFHNRIAAIKLPCLELGKVESDEFVVDEEVWMKVDTATHWYSGSLASYLSQ